MEFGIDGEFSAEFILEPTDVGTKLTWSYNGKVEKLM